MSKLKCSLVAKIFAWVFSFLAICVAGICMVASIYMVNNSFYDRTEKEIQLRVGRQNAYDIHYRLFNYYEDYRHTNSPYLISFDDLVSSMEDAKNFKYTFSDEEGNIISSNYNGESATRYDFESLLYLEEVWDSDSEPESEGYKTSVYVLNEKTEVDRFSIGEKFVSILYDMRFSIYAVLVVSVVVFFVLAAFLIASAGHKRAGGEIERGVCEKTPCDVFAIYAVCIFFANLLALIICEEISQIIYIFVIPVLVFFDYLFLSIWVKNIAINAKLGTLLSGLAIYKLFRFTLKPVINSLKNTKGLLRAGLLAFVPCVLLLFVLYFLLGGSMYYEIFLLWFICTAVYIALALYRTVKLQKIVVATEKIAAGDFSESVETDKLYGEMRVLGGNINQINSGLQIAVTDKMKSERFKTELITNVSHDLKTPLTSIINYIDLLEKLDLEDDTAKEYISVLSRQGARLKKLTEDLLEASKASTGNIKIELSRCDIGVLLSQTVGEFSERLESAELSVVMHIPEEPVFVMADGKRLYRVFENLMSNICKYSLGGTRVYLEAVRRGEFVKVSFKNISKEMITASDDELTKRFVRGDASRNTEGSGLGLSIAKSLTELQGGEFSIKVDGDLFSASVMFKVCE